MKVDNTTKLISVEISNELKEEGIDKSPQEIFEIANSQFIGIAIARNKGLGAILSYICTFVFKNSDAFVRSIEEMHKLKDKISEEEYKAIIKKKRIANKKVMKGSSHKLIKNLEDMPEDANYKCSRIEYWNNLYNQVINDEK